MLLANGALSAEARLAKVKVDADFIAPCDTSILYPTDGGNMHCFTAVTQCAVLDVLGPPYNDAEGRHCAYYIEHPLDRISGIYSLFFANLVICCSLRELYVFITYSGCCIYSFFFETVFTSPRYCIYFHCSETIGVCFGGVICSLIR